MLKWQVQGDVKGAIACWEDLVKMNPNHPQLNQVKQLIAHVKHQQSMQPTGVKP
jgi:cytochrome c-type biogenesis protein CcmH/NrfG